MTPSDELRRHATECGQIGHSMRNKENRAVWNSIAERYLRCAQSYDARRSSADRLAHTRVHKRPVLQADDPLS